MRFLGVGDYLDLGDLYLRLARRGHDLVLVARDRARPQIISITKPAGHNDRVDARERVFLMPNKPRRMPEHILQNVHCILVAIRRWKL